MRAKQHESETSSASLLRRHLPANWLIRDLTERDYGIDVLMEIVADGRMTGNVIVAQVKSLASFPVKRAERAYRKLERSTYNYLLGNPAPAYLFLCSLGDQTVYWRSIREVHRTRSSNETDKPTIRIFKDYDLSKTGQLALQLSVRLERQWPDVERAAISSLMFFHALGPLYLACRREPELRPLPSSVQLLVNQHYEYNQLLHTYLLKSGKRFPLLPEFYAQALARGDISEKMTFTAGFATKFISSFIGDYVEAIEICDCLIRRDQRPYWFAKYPFVVSQLDAFPPYFVDEDWYSRYHFDEYENETHHIRLDLFFDIDDGTRHDFRHFMTQAADHVDGSSATAAPRHKGRRA